MMLRHDAGLGAKITELVAGILAKHPDAGAVRADSDLARLGMTSIDMVELMLALEEEYDLTIPPAEITLDNFRSITAVNDMVARLLARRERSCVAA